MGVRRAVEMVLDAPNKHENPICTFGPLIHNPQVLNLLEEKGISILDEVPDHGSGTVLIRAHGVPLDTKENLKKAGFKVIDATCPRVIKVQTIIRKHARQGCAAIIIGDKEHPEVIGLLGYAEDKGYVVDNINDLDSLPSFKNAIIVAQTTQNTLFFEKVKTWANQNFPHYKIYDTICDSTAKRQAEVHDLADSVDAVIVVGGYNSGNTKRLAEIAQKTGKPTYHIQEASEIDMDALSEASCIGIAAGASTPNWIINKIFRKLEALPYKKKQRWKRSIFDAQRALLLTNIYVSMGAGCLCYACIKIQEISNYLPYVFISVLYVQSMHIFNNLIGTKADRYNDPDRSFFYHKNKIWADHRLFNRNDTFSDSSRHEHNGTFLQSEGYTSTFCRQQVPADKGYPGIKNCFDCDGMGSRNICIAPFVHIRKYSSEYGHHTLVVSKPGLCQDGIF